MRRRGRGRDHGRRAPPRGAGRRRHDGDVPARPDAHGRAQDRGRPRRRAVGEGALGGARARSDCGSAASRPERRRACIATRSTTPLRRRSGATTRRFRSRSARSASPRRPGPLLADRDQPARPRAHPREPPPQPDVLGPDPGHRAALLPVGRGQGRQVRRQGEPHDLSRARGTGTPIEIYINGLSTSLPEEVQREILARDSGTRERARCCGRATRSSTTSAFPISCARRSRRESVPGLYLGRADQRDLGLRGGGGAGAVGRNQRGARRARARRRFVLERSEAYAAVMVDDLVEQGARGAVPALHLARRVPAAARRGHGPAAASPARAAPRPGRASQDYERAHAGRGAARARAPAARRARDPSDDRGFVERLFEALGVERRHADDSYLIY